VNLTFLLKI